LRSSRWLRILSGAFARENTEASQTVKSGQNQLSLRLDLVAKRIVSLDDLLVFFSSSGAFSLFSREGFDFFVFSLAANARRFIGGPARLVSFTATRDRQRVRGNIVRSVERCYIRPSPIRTGATNALSLPIRPCCGSMWGRGGEGGEGGKKNLWKILRSLQVIVPRRYSIFAPIFVSPKYVQVHRLGGHSPMVLFYQRDEIADARAAFK